MPAINFGSGADGPTASLEFNTKYDTTFFPSDLADTPYFIIFRAQKEYKLSQLADVKPRHKFVPGGGTATQPAGEELNIEITRGTLTAGQRLSNAVRGTIGAAGNFFKDLESAEINITQPAHSFALPIPSNLATSYNAQYNSSAELGVGGSIGRSIAERSLVNGLQEALRTAPQNEFTSDNVRGILGNAALAVAETDALTTAVGAAVTGQLAGVGTLGALTTAAAAAVAGSIGTGTLVGLGLARNPHIANVFTGVNFRTHQFNYKLIAKNKKESDTIRDLIRNFKFHMAPDYNGSNHIFTYPSKFQIILKAGDYLFKIGNSILTDFTVDYNGEGAPYFFEDTNAPYSITISMTFVEDTIVTKREIRQGR